MQNNIPQYEPNILSLDSTSLIIAAAIMAALLFWSSAVIGIRIGLQAYTPGALGLLRYLTTLTIASLIYFRLPERTPIRKRHIPSFIVMSTFGMGLYSIALNNAEMTVPAGIAGFILGLLPVFSILFAGLFLNEKINRNVIIGIGICLFGTAMIAYSKREHLDFQWGLLECIAATVLGGISITIQRSLTQYYKPVELTCYMIAFGSLPLLIYIPELLPTLHALPKNETLAGIYLGIFPGLVAHTSWTYVLSKMPSSQAAAYLYFIPIISVMMGYFILQEIPNSLSLMGGMMTLVGAIYATRA